MASGRNLAPRTCARIAGGLSRGKGNERYKWELVDSGESDSPFLLVDVSGNCAIDPDQAEVMTTRKATWTREGYRYTEHVLLSKDNLSPLGEFATLGGASAELDFKSDLKALLSP